MFFTVTLSAQNWNMVKSSGEYYYGEGQGASEEEADQAALVNLSSMIATHVSSSFSQESQEVQTNGHIDNKEYARLCMKSYTQTSLINCERMSLGEKGGVYSVGRYMKRSELSRIFESRINKAQDFVERGDRYLERKSIGHALQYYYWAYALVCSVQHPNEVRDSQGNMLIASLPDRIRDILEDVKVEYAKRSGDEVEMRFSYKEAPIRSELYFTYSDGQGECSGHAKDGTGYIEMMPGFDGEFCHIDIDYECRNRATDAEIASVLNVARMLPMSAANYQVKMGGGKGPSQPASVVAAATVPTVVGLHPSEAQLADNIVRYDATMQQVIKAITRRDYTGVMNSFTFDGYDIFSRLVSYGKGRIVGTPDLKYFKSHGGTVVARGLQMGFTFNEGKKTSVVEDVAFTFQPDGKISNVAFGLGSNTENDILCKYAPDWSNEARELLMEFLENYKTAYSLERHDYIKTLFADDAVIIIGNVAKVFTPQKHADRPTSLKGQDIINYNRYTKDEYLDNLKACFDRNDYINIRFTQCDVQPLEKLDGEVYGIQLGQDYQSSTYQDFGYLFLMVNMTDPNAPYIKVRTWQEKPDPNFGWYNAGDFYE